MPLYEDPAGPRNRPSLIRDLFLLPSKATNHPLENQTTAVLAWVADNSPAFARALLTLFLGDKTPAADVFGARTWVKLPKPAPEIGRVFPDLSIEGADRAVHLLIEVKVSAELAKFVLPNGRVVTQEQYYRYAWQRLHAGEAGCRAVGTLSRQGGETPVDLDGLQARDVTWKQVRDCLNDLLHSGSFEPRVQAVVESFRDALTELIVVEPLNLGTLAEWLEDNEPTAKAVAEQLAALLPESVISSVSGAHFRGRRVRVDSLFGRQLELRVYVAPAGSKQNFPGAPDSLIVRVEQDPNGNLEDAVSAAVQEVGILKRKDVAGAAVHRAWWPVEDAARDPVGVASEVMSLLSAAQRAHEEIAASR